MIQQDNSESGSGTLQQPLNRYPASRWQQLRQTLGTGSSTVPAQLRASAPGLSAAGVLPKHLCMSSSIPYEHGNTAGLSQPGLLQEAADVLRRCTDTGAALQAHETQLAAAALSSLGQYRSSKDQFTIHATGRICVAWADADQPLEQLLSEAGSAARESGGVDEPSISSIHSIGCLYPSTAPHAAAAAAFAAAKHGQQQQRQQAAAAAAAAATVSRGSAQQLARQASQPVTARHSSSSSTVCGSRGSTTGSRVSGSAARPAAAGAAVLAEHDRLLTRDLAHDLAALLARKLMHRWQQHTAGAKVDRARAPPMQRLLSKRKVLRAWTAVMSQRATAAVAAQPGAAAGKQPGPPADLNQQDLQQQQQQQQQLSRREQVAGQFHRLYRLHGCLRQWRRCAAAGVLARSMQETDRIMAQQQAEILEQQQEQEHQELQQQESQHKRNRLAVAVRFHQLLVLHESFIGIGSIDRQQLQQKLRQLLATEQRKQREEQRKEQLLLQQLAEQQETLAGMHYKLVLARRLGLQPWLALLKLRTQQQQAAESCRAVGLSRTAMLLWKELLLQRRVRHTCRHIRAYGKLQQLRQRQQQQAAITALANWASASRQCKRQLLLRMVAAWRVRAAAARQQLLQVQHAAGGRLLRRTLRAWRRNVEGQAQEQLLLEHELNAVATKWQHRRAQQHVMRGWSRAAAAAVQEREQQARLQETFSKVQGWLSEMKDGAPDSKISTTSAADSSANAFVVQGAAVAPAGRAAVPAQQHQLPPWRDWYPDSDTD
ncbi:hypothetical protein COO60DRAFT_1684103 [Scenedesmus sp. NREL 46B-D3]|nr:hypothetical protein COO60DRAFT_1684103 [Scenedesmus sp. NREL 46B-D3]